MPKKKEKDCKLFQSKRNSKDIEYCEKVLDKSAKKLLLSKPFVDFISAVHAYQNASRRPLNDDSLDDLEIGL